MMMRPILLASLIALGAAHATSAVSARGSLSLAITASGKPMAMAALPLGTGILVTEAKEANPHAAHMRGCIGDCLACRGVCLKSAAYCKKMGGKHAEPAHLRLLADCAEMCRTSAGFMRRGSTFHGDTCGLCAKICQECAKSCDQFPNDRQMKACGAECRKCAASCQMMAGMKM